MFRKKKPNLKDVTTRELFAELAIRFEESNIIFGDVPLKNVLVNAPHYINAGVLNRKRV